MTDSVSFTFEEALARWWPGATSPPLPVAEAARLCERIAASHYENFTVGSLLLPRAMRQPMAIVYAYCRTADDLGDEIGDPKHSLALLTWWEETLRRGVAGEEVAHPVVQATAHLIREHRLPLEPFCDLLVAFRRDQEPTQYDTLDDLLDYCRYSANPVGRIVLALAAAVTGAPASSGPQAESMLAWSDSICTGLQLVNHWQDVARDLAIGRCYLPRDIAERHGYARPITLAEAMARDADASQRAAFRSMMAFLVDDAQQRLEAGWPLASAVPRGIRLDVRLFLLGGLAVARAIRTIDYNVWHKRPTISRVAKAWLVVMALLRGAFSR